MARTLREATRKMTRQLCRRVVRVNVRWSILERVSVIGDFFRFVWDRIVVCSLGRSSRYRRLSRRSSSQLLEAVADASASDEPTTTCGVCDTDQAADSVNLKISLLGDCQIGKTSFVVSIIIITFLFPFIYLILQLGLNFVVIIINWFFFFFSKDQVCWG